jgi:hypothetical protein
MHCGSAGRDSDGMSHSDVFREALFELNRLWPHGKPAGADNLRNGLGLILSDWGAVKRDCLLEGPNF